MYRADETTRSVRLGGLPKDWGLREEKGGPRSPGPGWSKHKVVQQKDSLLRELISRQNEGMPCTASATLGTERSHSLPELLT